MTEAQRVWRILTDPKEMELRVACLAFIEHGLHGSPVTERQVTLVLDSGREFEIVVDIALKLGFYPGPQKAG